jgi:hypothetical protein
VRPAAIAMAAARMELAATVRRPGVLAAIAALAAFPALTYHHLFSASTPAQVVATQAYYLNTFAPVAIGVTFADRYLRDATLGVREVLDALPASAAARMWGRFAGLVIAGALPVLAVWAVQVVHIALVLHRGAVFGAAAASFAAGILPGLVMVCGLSLIGPVIMGLPLFRVLFVCYWFWGNLVPSQLFPSPSETWVTPIGGVALTGLFHPPLGYHYAAAAAAASISIVLAIGVALVATLQYLDHRRRATA